VDITTTSAAGWLGLVKLAAWPNTGTAQWLETCGEASSKRTAWLILRAFAPLSSSASVGNAVMGLVGLLGLFGLLGLRIPFRSPTGSRTRLRFSPFLFFLFGVVGGRRGVAGGLAARPPSNDDWRALGSNRIGGKARGGRAWMATPSVKPGDPRAGRPGNVHWPTRVRWLKLVLSSWV